MRRRCFAFAATLALWMGCYAQDIFQYKPLPGTYSNLSAAGRYRTEAASLTGGAYDLTKALPAGYVKDGSVDYTTALQNALNTNKVVKMPNFPVLINDNGLLLKSNSTVIFQPNSSLVLQSSNKGKYAMLKMLNVQNVKLYNPVLVGDKDHHSGNGGEWGMGIDVRSSDNINIYHPQVSKCWGDGIYIGQADKSKPNTNVNIYYANVDNNRRNGITIGSVKGLKLINPVVSNTSGTLPMAGIDIEPNSSAEQIDDILIDNPVTFNNAKYGLVVGLGRLPGPDQKQVNITINKHLDDGSGIAFWMGGMDGKYTAADKPLAGNIQVIDPVWKNNSNAFKSSRNYEFAPKCKFKNISIQKPGSNNEVDKLKKAQANKKNLEIE
ncbi:Right handed beta helix region [Chitinophaga jiangningensis]|uniref:Right handed beta helix region n=1 Tax=Chitinophaga jiangningensis TaxID=1419482 RepID=A0A1M7M3J4_9BACT|nr:right-handed parallel beta-helix repeat-containing protein [Chitinophaga jiangningensis]SHM85246.1 Right handed beta helix region [Chitinophaga jiangningensis]